MKPKAGVTVKPTVFAKQCYTITQCISDRLSRAPYLHPQPVETTGFLDRSWNPPKPGFLSIRGGQVDVKNHCCYLPGFGEFEWDDAPVPKELDAIKIRGKWALENIERVQIPQLKGIDGLHRCVIQFNKKAVSQLKMLWQAWEECGLLSKIVMFDAGFVERYQRRCNHTAISNHAFGTAFDINVQWNGFGCLPARLGEYGCVRQLAEVANQYGFYWGGHWGGLEKKGWDGMHFEVAKIM
ncbi:MAG: M15 family metallopeptidase [Pyrinomonadaceae bacterium]